MPYLEYCLHTHTHQWQYYCDDTTRINNLFEIVIVIVI